MNRSVFDFFSAAVSTSSRIFDTVESSNAFVAFTVSDPSPFMQPDTTVSPGPAARGTDSPVSAAVEMRLSPVRTSASTGILSPGRMSRTSPTDTSSGSTVSTVPSGVSSRS